MNRERACKDMPKNMEERLVLYHYGELSRQERSDVEAHLEKCGGCLRELDGIRNALESAPVYVPDAGEVRDAVRDVMRAVRHAEDRRQEKKWWNRRRVPAYFAAAAAAAAIVLSVYLPDVINKPPQENQVMAQADWEMLENFDIARDFGVIEELDNFEELEERL